MGFKKKIVLIDDKKTFYWEKNRGQKKSIVLLHGFPGSHEGLVDMANGLKDYHLIIPDLPACGLSEPLPGKHNLDNYSLWLKGFLDSLSINSPILIGHSFGSRVGLIFCDKYPGKIKKLVLITPVVKMEGLVARFVSVEYEIAKILPQKFKKQWLSNRVHRKVGDIIIFKSVVGKRRQKLIERENNDIKKLDPKVNIELFDEFYKFNLLPVGKKIKNKSLVIAGELDEIASLDSVKKLAEELTNSNLVVMKKCGHVVVAEKPLTTAGIIRNWLL